MTAEPGERAARTLEDAILGRVEERAAAWFPEVGPTPAIRLRRMVERPRAVLYAVHVGDDAGPPRILAKVRRDWSVGAAGQAGARPRLVTDAPSTAELTAVEYAGLCSIRAIFDGRFPGLAGVRPLDHLADENTILMEFVDARTLRHLLVQESRLTPRRPRRRRPDGEDVWRRAGAWLRVYQEEMPRDGLPARQSTRTEVADLFCAYDAFLADRLGRRALGDVARRGAELARRVLPSSLPLAVSHGDYAPRNVFRLGDGCVAGFDPLPRRLVPRYEDLARFLVAIRLSGQQVHTHGAAYPTRFLDRREQAVLDGYAGDERVPLAELACYQLLITLDRWSALVGARPRDWKGRLRSAPVEFASGLLRAEAERLIDKVRPDTAGDRA